MKKIGFIGAYDKTDFIIYIAKILTEMKKTVLIIDTTITQKAKYVVPNISPTQTYFTEYENIDIAVGFRTLQGMYEYLGIDENQELDYDYIFLDIDSPESFHSFSMETAYLNYFVSSFDIYSLKKGMEILNSLEETVKMTRILFAKIASREGLEYLEFLSQNCNVEWDEEKIFFPLEQGDQSAIIENQIASKIKTKNLSNQYRENLMLMASKISGNMNFVELKKILKNIDKGV